MADACPFFRRCKAALIELNGLLHDESKYLNAEGDRCFCLSCIQRRGEAHLNVVRRGEPAQSFVLPVGYARVGLKVHASPDKVQLALEEGGSGKWHVCFHGTRPEYVSDIIKQGQLLKPGAMTLSGDRIAVRSGHIKSSFVRENEHTGKVEDFDPTNKIFLSPSMKYCDHRGIYMSSKHCRDGSPYRFAFQVRIQPGSYRIGQQTVDAESQIDAHVPNSCLEWYTDEMHSHVLTGVIIGSLPLPTSTRGPLFYVPEPSSFPAAGARCPAHAANALLSVQAQRLKALLIV